MDFIVPHPLIFSPLTEKCSEISRPPLLHKYIGAMQPNSWGLRWKLLLHSHPAFSETSQKSNIHLQLEKDEPYASLYEWIYVILVNKLQTKHKELSLFCSSLEQILADVCRVLQCMSKQGAGVHVHILEWPTDPPPNVIYNIQYIMYVM